MCGAPLSARGNIDWMRKLAFRYRRIRDVYAANCTNIAGSISVIIIIIIIIVQYDLSDWLNVKMFNVIMIIQCPK